MTTAANNTNDPTLVPRGKGKQVVITKRPSFLTLSTFPGNSLYGETAEIISNGIRSNRTCTIQISNHLNVPLTDPQFYCDDGGLYYPLPRVIQPGSREACVFSKDPSTAHGVIGIITFQIGDSPHRIAILFSVAYNQLEYRNHFAMAILNEMEERDKEWKMSDPESLFDSMYQDLGFYQGVGRTHSFANDGVAVWSCDDHYQMRGAMSDRGKAIVKINITQGLGLNHVHTIKR